MKRLTSSDLVLFLTISAMLFAGADTISGAGLADGGRLIVKPSPALGYDVGIVITIDGKIAGSVVRGQNLETYVGLGHHVVLGTPNHLGGDARVALDVRRGQTYCFVASYSIRQAALTPARQCP